VQLDYGTRDRKGRRLGNVNEEELIHPISEESDPSFSQPVPEFISAFRTEKDIDFLLETFKGQCEKVVIRNVSKILSEEESRPIHSRPLIARLHGCMFCLYVHFNRGNVAIGIRLMKGSSDKRFVWPFNMIVLLRLENLNGGKDIVKMFRCEKNGSRLNESVMKPRTDMNPPIGYSRFTTQQYVQSDGFIKNNEMLVKLYLFPKDANLSIASEYPSMIR
jgi:hypothetical protein